MDISIAKSSDLLNRFLKYKHGLIKLWYA